MEKNTVFIESAFGVVNVLFIAANEDEAYEFCNAHKWKWVDENGFVWELDYVDAEEEE